MRAFFFFFIAAAACAAADGPVDGDTVLFQQDLVANLNGEEVGTMSAYDVKKPDGKKVLVRKYDLVLPRGKQSVAMKTTTVATLSAKNEPLSYRFIKTEGGSSLVVDAVVVDAGKNLRLTTNSQGSSVENIVPLPKGATFMLAVEHEARSSPTVGSGKRMVVLEELNAVTELTANTTKTKDGTFVVQTSFGVGGVTIVTDEEIDAQGRTLVSRTPGVGIVAYPWGKAPKDIDDLLKGNKKADLLAVSTWKTKKFALPVQRVVYRVTTPDAAAFQVPTDSRQKVLARTATTVDVEVKAGPSTTTALNAAQKKRALSATPYEPINDPRIVKAAKDAVGDAVDDETKVKRLAAFVFGHVKKKGLDRGYLPAIATLESRTGDCTEHSVLLSALLKAQGIPARIVDGVIVDDGNAGYHEWVEVNLGKGFVAVDPTFNAWPAGPERLKLAEGSTLPDEHLNLSLAAARLLKSGVTLEVISVE